MPGKQSSEKRWFAETLAYTRRLVGIRSVSPGEGEIQVAEEVLNLLRADGLDALYTASGLDPLEHDPHGRQNAFAFLQGQTPATLVLLGHIDTVGTQDYGPLESLALSTDELSQRHAELQQGPLDCEDDWLFGRGVVDMKSGVAANIALMRRFALQARDGRPSPLSIVLLAVADEENESAGVLQAVRFLLRLQARYGLEYVGTINTDYTTERYPADPHRYVYTGTIGKLLPSFLCIGKETHVGSPFNGLDANLLSAELIRDLSMNDELCDTVRDQITPPPVSLHATDLKSSYDVQLPFMAYFYLNVLTFTTGPDALLSRLHARAEQVLDGLLAHIDRAEQRWHQASTESSEKFQARTGKVYTYAELYTDTCKQLGAARVQRELDEEGERWPATLDKRERCLHLVRRLWTISGKQGPAIVIYYAPPYYPHVAAVASPLHAAVGEVVAAHAELQVQLREYYPYLSDLSYLNLQEGIDVAALEANLPIWRNPDEPHRSGAYSLPLAEIQQLHMPVINFGPYGRGAHQRNESILMSYSFEQLPQMLYETVENLAARVAHQGMIHH